MKKILPLFLILNSVAFADTNQEEIKEVLAQNHYEPNYFSMILGLFVVVSLIYLTGFLYQKLLKIKLQDANSDSLKPQIVSSVQLGQNKNLYVIKIKDEYSLIGASANNISLIKELKNVSKDEK